MNLRKRLFGREPSGSRGDTGLSAREWIVATSGVPLAVVEVGPILTLEGRVCSLDPLAFGQLPGWIAVPRSGGDVVVFHDRTEGRNSKLALVLSGDAVAGGADAGVCLVDAGMASLFTPSTHAALTSLIASLGQARNIYDDFFAAFDDPQGGERKIVPLPDGTPVPYVHAGYGDGAYPVFTLTNASGAVTAIYVDFMGVGADGEWLLPPGMASV